MNVSKSRDIQAKMPSPKVMAFWLVTVKGLNSYVVLKYFEPVTGEQFSVNYK